MSDVSKDLIQLIFALVPGFFTAWVLYGFTAYKKPSAFERLVQALVFTIIIKVLVMGVRETALYIGNKYVVGMWTLDGELAWSIVIAFGVGLIAAYAANNNTVHNFAWRLRITNGSSYPSVWYKLFATKKRWIILHLNGQRRLYGWPMDWPDHSDSGYFAIKDAEWLSDTGDPTPLDQVEQILIPVSEVEMVEFVHDIPPNIGTDPETIDLTEQQET